MKLVGICGGERMKVKLDKVCKRIYAGGDVPKDRYSTVMTSEYTIPIYANAEKDDGLYGYTDTARENELSITVAARGTIGFTAIRREPFLPVVRLITVVPDLSKVSERYLYYALGNCKPASSGTSIPQLTVPDIRKNEIELYSLSVQDKIADKLDMVGRIIELRKQELQKLDELVKARFVEMFGAYPLNPMGWKKGTIRDVVADVRYGSSRPAVDGGKYPYLRMNNITYGGELDLSDVKRIDVPENELGKCTVRRGDVLFNRTNSKELVGKTCVYDRDEMMVLAGFVIRVRVNDLVLPEFLSAFLNTDFSKMTLLGMCKAAIGQANINAQEMQNIGIYIPPIELQKEFVQFKNQTDKSKAVVQKALDEAQLLFDSLMQKYFG